jgi:hypothetical protein
MTKFIRTCTLTAGGIVATLTGMDCLYTYGVARHPLLNIPENHTYDYLIIGDSRVSSLIEKDLSAQTGKSVIVLPHYGDNLKDVIKLTDYFLKRGNRAKTVISNVDMRIAQSSGMSHEWEFYAYDVHEQHYLKPRIPFAIYALNNRKIPFRKVMEGIRQPIDTVRAEHRDLSIFQKYEPSREQKIPYDTSNLRLDLILELREKLKQHGIHDHRLIVAPLSPEYARYHPGRESYKDIMRNNGFRLYDCSAVYGDTAAFVDLIHLKRNHYLDFSRKFADSLNLDNGSKMTKLIPTALKNTTIAE